MEQYKVLDDISHVIQCKNMYLGNSNDIEEKTFIYNIDKKCLEYKLCKFNSGLIKIFDEILVNAIDNFARSMGDEKMTYIKCNFNEYITIENDGSSIPIEKYTIKPKQKNETEEKYKTRVKNEENLQDKYLPEIIFTKLRSSSNYNNDNENRITGGLNGIGAKLTVIFSKKFEIKIANKNKLYEQVIEDNCTKINKPKITKLKDNKNFVSISFIPDWKLIDKNTSFTSLNEDLIGILLKRLFDYTHLDLSIIYDDFTFPKLSYLEFANSHIKLLDEDVKLYESYFDNWKICFGFASKKNCVISYVNNIPTYENGKHVEVIKKQIASYVRNKSKNKTLSLKSLYTKLSFCIYSIIPGATFSSQAKTSLSKMNINVPKLSEVLLDKFTNETGILDFAILGKIKKINTKTTRTRITNISKLLDAEEAGKPLNKRKDKGHICSLFICEGDSAQSLCIRGIKYLGEQYYGSFALRGKVLNTQKASEKKYLENIELTNLKKAIGLIEGKVYKDTKELRYQRIICCKDADFDGSLIMGLLVNFFYQYFKELILIPGFFCEFVTPVINVYKMPYIPKTSYPFKSFNNLAEFEKDSSVKNCYCKYIKGLGGNSDNDIETYFKEFDKHLVRINCNIDGTDENIKLVYSNEKGFTDKRKEWISKVNIDSYLPRDRPEISFNEICDIDLALASNDTCERSIPSAIDGLKPAQRKVIYTLFSMSEVKSKTPTKVFQLTGKVSDFAAYHHGNQSLDDVIIRMAQDFVGANNITLLERDGQFGTRNKLGNDASAPRYIAAYLGDYTRTIYPKYDDKLLKFRLEDNVLVEPYYYVPIIPIILVNGCQGIGTGWSTNIPMFNPLDLISLTSKWLCELKKNKEILTHFNLSPWYRNYRGKIYNDSVKNNWAFVGNIEKVNKSQYKVNEIPINLSISDFRETLNNLIEKKIIKDYSNVLKTKDSNIDKDAFEFLITFTEEFSENIEKGEVNLISLLNLKTTISKTNIVAYDSENHIKLFKTIEDLFKEWFYCRLKFYDKRKELIIHELEYEIMKNENKLRFIKNLDNYNLNYKNKEQIITLLTNKKYDRIEDSYEYLLKIPIYSLSKENIEILQNKIENFKKELNNMKTCSIYKLWNDDLIHLYNIIE